VIDTGGDDTYRIPAGANSELTNPVSVLIDLAGNDHYGYPAAPSARDQGRLASDADGRAAQGPPQSLSNTSRQGVGRLGIGFLFDLGTGNDHYQSLRASQGFGVLGVGVLFDEGGHDRYQGEVGVQGSAQFGIGLLIDRGGDDRYECYGQAQGFAYGSGVGLLYDRSGDDDYWADPGNPLYGGDPLYPSSQLGDKGNANFAQGAALGRRADTTDQAYIAGGLGILRDYQGNDSYRAGVFGQGVGYWLGVGLLLDRDGDDQYDGLWYVQGAAAHIALALFVDQSGDDRYNQRFEPVLTSIGVGHDFSVAWHIDLAGNDSYRAPGLSLGSGNDNGMGLMINAGGADTYQSLAAPTLGSAPLADPKPEGNRAKILTLGVFVDTTGTDNYLVPGTSPAQDQGDWHYLDLPRFPTAQKGIGVDLTNGHFALP
jgi:hypothetical protein